MAWNLDEAVAYYRRQGAPQDQTAVVSLLREIQGEHGGAIPVGTVTQVAEALGVKEGFLLAFVRRIPSLRLDDKHILEICGGPNCSKRAALLDFVEKHWGKDPKGFAVRQVGCLRQCGQGPNIRWDGKLYTGADEALLRNLIEKDT